MRYIRTPFWPYIRIGALPEERMFQPNELVEFQKSYDRIVNAMARVQKSLTPRERVVLQVGLRGSHIEEALAQGDWDRARAHSQKLVELLKAL